MRGYFEFAAKTPILIATFIGIFVLVAFVFPVLPVGGELLDLKPGYSQAEVFAAMEEYGADGRRLYAWMSPTLDTLFPLIYVTFFAGVIYRFRLTEKLWVLAFIPVVAGIWDLCENAQITAMLIQYPDISESQVGLASTFTQIKSSVFGPIYQLLALALLLIAGVRFLIGRIRGSE